MKKTLDYFPIIAYFGFWLQGALAGALLIGETKYLVLGVVTLPAIIAMIIAVIRIRKKNET